MSDLIINLGYYSDNVSTVKIIAYNSTNTNSRTLKEAAAVSEFPLTINDVEEEFTTLKLIANSADCGELIQYHAIPPNRRNVVNIVLGPFGANASANITTATADKYGNIFLFQLSSINSLIKYDVNLARDNDYKPRMVPNWQFNSPVVTENGEVIMFGEYFTWIDDGQTIRNNMLQTVKYKANSEFDLQFHQNLKNGIAQHITDPPNVNGCRTIEYKNGFLWIGFSNEKHNYELGYNTLHGGDLFKVDLKGNVDNGFNMFLKYNVTNFKICQDGKIMVVWKEGPTAYKLIRVNSDGSKDNTFKSVEIFGYSTNVGYSSLVYFGEVRDVQVHDDGRVMIVGSFILANGTSGSIMRILSDGTVDPTFIPGTVNNDEATNDVANKYLNTVIILANGKYLVSGRFKKYNDISYPMLVRLNSDGSVDNTFKFHNNDGITFNEYQSPQIIRHTPLTFLTVNIPITRNGIFSSINRVDLDGNLI